MPFPNCSATRCSGEDSLGQGQPTTSSTILAGLSMVCRSYFFPGQLSFGAPGQDGSSLHDPVNCPVGAVLEFLQERFSTGLSPSTLNVNVASGTSC